MTKRPVQTNIILVDEIDLQWGVQWKQKIEELIQSCDAVILILTPSYFKSRMCIYEFKCAIEYKKKVCPLYFLEVKEVKNGFQSSFNEDGSDSKENIALNEASSKIQGIQYRDFRQYKNKDVYCEEIQDFLDRLADEITSSAVGWAAGESPTSNGNEIAPTLVDR